jgi:hypothetical protein
VAESLLVDYAIGSLKILMNSLFPFSDLNPPEDDDLKAADVCLFGLVRFFAQTFFDHYLSGRRCYDDNLRLFLPIFSKKTVAVLKNQCIDQILGKTSCSYVEQKNAEKFGEIFF